MATRRYLLILVLGTALAPTAHAADTESTAAAGCEQLMTAAQQFGAQVQQLQQQLTQTFAATGDDMARELAPAMRRLGEQLQTLAQRLERPGVAE